VPFTHRPDLVPALAHRAARTPAAPASRDTAAVRAAAARQAGPGARAARVEPAQPTPPTAIPARQLQVAAGAERPAAPPAQVARAETAVRAAPAIGWISVRTNPRSMIYLNDTARRSPVEGLPVPAGTLRLRFMDTTGAWFAHDTTVTVVPGARLVLGTIQLGRP
jgi:hypothetical protein